MRMLIVASAIALGLSLPAAAQETPQPVTTGAPATADGSKPFGIEPYFGVLGGYHSFDRKPGFTGPVGERFDGAQIEGCDQGLERTGPTLRCGMSTRSFPGLMALFCIRALKPT